MADPRVAALRQKAPMQGFGEIFDNDRLNKASEREAGALDYDDAMYLMRLGQPQNVPYGGKKSWAQAAAEGLQTGLGMYNMLNTQQAKKSRVAEQLRAYKDKYSTQEPVGGAVPEAGQLYDAQGIPLTNKGQYGFGD